MLLSRRTLLARHATHAQAAFFLKQRGQRVEEVQERHELVKGAVAEVQRCIPPKWRRGHIDRSDLSRFVFEPQDLVVPVGRTVANGAKYLSGPRGGRGRSRGSGLARRNCRGRKRTRWRSS